MGGKPFVEEFAGLEDILENIFSTNTQGEGSHGRSRSFSSWIAHHGSGPPRNSVGQRNIEKTLPVAWVEAFPFFQTADRKSVV